MTNHTYDFEEAWAAADATSAKADNRGPENKTKERIVDKLIKIAINQTAGDHPDAGGLFHAPNSIAYADIHIGQRRETWPIRSKGFRQWLVRVYYEVNGTAPNSEALQTAIGLAEARAVIDGPERMVFVRTGAHGGKLYLDLANENWEAGRSPPPAGASSPVRRSASVDRRECDRLIARSTAARSIRCACS